MLAAIKKAVGLNVANDIGWAAVWCVQNKGKYAFHYQQVRPFSVAFKFPKFIDCSGFVSMMYRWAGAPDPYRMGYAGVGNTMTLLRFGKKIALKDVQPGDVVVYAADQGIQHQHAAIIVQRGADPLTVSMGQEGDPSFVRVSQDGRTPTYLRFDTSRKWKPVPLPKP